MTRTERVALIAVLGLLAIFALREVGSPDLGFHLKAGEQILEGGGWPRNDTFTFTVGDHPYIDTSWGYQVLIAAIQKIAGVPGMVLFHALVALAILLLVLASTRLGPTPPWLVLPLLLIAVIGLEIRLEVRPAWASFLLLALVLHLLHRRAAGLKVSLWWLPPIFLVWANTHTFFVLGWLVLACFALGLLIRDRRPDSQLWSVAAVSGLVALINPYGWKALALQWVQATRLQGENLFAREIGELLSLSDIQQLPFHPRAALIAIQLLLGLSALAGIGLLRQRRFPELLLALVFLPLSFGALRMAPLMVVVCLPGTVWGLAELCRWVGAERRLPWSANLRKVLALLLAAAAILVSMRVVTDAYYIQDRRRARFGFGWNPRMLPLEAAEFANTQQPGGAMFNQLGFGGYLMWATDRPVFIDGRLEVIGEPFYQSYDAIRRSPAALDRALERYGIGWLVFPYRRNPYPAMLDYLSRHPSFTLAHVDALSAVFLVRGRSGSAVPDASARRVDDPHPPPDLSGLPGLDGVPRAVGSSRFLQGFVRRGAFPERDYRLGQFHQFRGELQAAAWHFDRAIRQSEGAYFELYNNLGTALMRVGRLEQAAECLRIYLQHRPNAEPVLQRLEEIEQRRHGVVSERTTP